MSSQEAVNMTDLRKCTKTDIIVMNRNFQEICAAEKLADRVIQMFLGQKGVSPGLKIDIVEHGLQTATRAYRDGADEETVVCCLLHDIGVVLSPSNHGEIAAGILRPYISEKNWWVLAHHEPFQGYYYYEHKGLDKNKRDAYKDSPYYEDAVKFCALYDSPSLDPDYDSMDIEEFRPMIVRIFSRPPFSQNPSHPKIGAVAYQIQEKNEL